MGKSLFRDILTILLLVYLAMKLLCNIPENNYSQIVFISWFGCSFIAYTSKVKKVLQMKMLLPFYFFLVYYGVTLLINHTVLYTISGMISMCQLFSPFLMYKLLREETKFLRWIVFFSITAIFVSNYVACFSYMSSSFTGRGLRDIEDFLLLKNTFFVVYSSAIFVPTIIYFIHRTKNEIGTNKFIKVLLGYVVCAILAYFVIQAQFMTAIVLMIIGVALAFSYNRRGTIVVITLFTMIVYVLFVNNANELIAISDSNGATATSVRIKELQYILSNNSSNAEDFSLRQGLTQSSFQTFIENPILGTAYKYKDFEESKLYVGNHAEWVDTLARYGLFGLCLFYFLFKLVKKQRLIVGFSISYILFGIIGFLNPALHFYLICALFLYIPLMHNVIFKNIRFKIK